MTTPTIGVWMWFYSQFRHPDDYAAVLISNNNGTTWVPMDTLRGLRNHWAEYDYAVANYVTNTVSGLLGNGDGTLGAKTDFGTGDGTAH